MERNNGIDSLGGGVVRGQIGIAPRILILRNDARGLPPPPCRRYQTAADGPTCAHTEGKGETGPVRDPGPQGIIGTSRSKAASYYAWQNNSPKTLCDFRPQASLYGSGCMRDAGL